MRAQPVLNDDEGLTCTRCFRPTYAAPDIDNLQVETIVTLCEHWMCRECLDEEEGNQYAGQGRVR